MKPQVIAYINGTKELVNMFSYLYSKDINQVRFDEYELLNGDMPISITEHTVDINNVVDEMFCYTFGLDINDLKRKGFFDYKRHQFPKINQDEHKIVTLNQLVDYSAIEDAFGIAKYFSVIKINDLKTIYKETMEKLFGEIFIYKACKEVYDRSNVHEPGFLTGIDNNEYLFEFRRAFSFTGVVLDLQGNSNLRADYRLIPKIIRSGNKLEIFNHMKSTIKKMLL